MKVKGGLKYISLDDLYNKLKCLEIDTKGYSAPASALSNVAFFSSTSSSHGKTAQKESSNAKAYLVSSSSSSLRGSSSQSDIVGDVIHSLIAEYEPDQHLIYEDLEQVNKETFKEYELKHEMAMLEIKPGTLQGSMKGR